MQTTGWEVSENAEVALNSQVTAMMVKMQINTVLNMQMFAQMSPLSMAEVSMAFRCQQGIYLNRGGQHAGWNDTEKTLRIHTEFFILTVFLCCLLVIGHGAIVLVGGAN